MTVTNVDKDAEALSLTITAEFEAPAERVWQLWADPRQLERWWGPPDYPATVVEHALEPGAAMRYYMTSPEGDRHHGWWNVLSVDPPRRVEFDEGFADAAGAPDPDMPVTRMVLSVEDRPGGGTIMTVASTFSSVAAMEQLMAMGMDEGMTLAMGQIDDLLADVII